MSPVFVVTLGDIVGLSALVIVVVIGAISVLVALVKGRFDKDRNRPMTDLKSDQARRETTR